MTVFTSPPELFTGLTDLLTSALAFAFFFAAGRADSYEKKLWRMICTALGLSGISGFAAHSFVISEKAKDILWYFVPLFMCFTVTLFFMLSYTLFSPGVNRKRLLTAGILSSLVSYAVIITLSFFYEKYLLVFTLYAALCLLPSIGLFIYLAVKKKAAYYLFFIAGLCIQAPGGIIQAQRKLIIGGFDFNSIYHLITCVSLTLLFIGFLSHLRAQKKSLISNNH